MFVPDFDDIVFEKLNKDYGAYILRKGYKRILSLSIILAIIIGIIVVIVPYLRIPGQKSKEIYTERYITVENLMHPDEQGGTPPPPVQTGPPEPEAKERQIASELRYIAPEIVDSIPPVNKQMVSSADSIREGNIGQNISNGNRDGTGSVSGTGTGKGGEGGAGTGNGLYTRVDIMPTFKGGDLEKFREWVQKKTKYPQIATVNGIQGRVLITFVIETDGSVSSVKVVRGVDPLIDDEALKSVRSSPKWTPGISKGKAVRVSYYISVNFEL
jgi:protein TonB